MAEKEFRVNEHIVLKLEAEKNKYDETIFNSYIYVGEKRIRNCMKLVIFNPHLDVRLENIDSIDEVADLLQAEKKSIWEDFKEEEEELIDPETEFWGHCSNIQTWVEHGYDTRLISANLAFPLLKELSDIGVPNAKIIFQEELAMRFQSGYTPVVEYLYLMKYHKKLTLEQKIDIDFPNIYIPIRERLRQIKINRIEDDWKLTKQEKELEIERLRKSFLDPTSEFNK